MTSSSWNFFGMTDPSSDENLPYHVDIILHEKIYHPGDVICGEVIFRLSKNLSCDLINVQLFGSTRVFWIDKQVFFCVNNINLIVQNLHYSYGLLLLSLFTY